MTSAAEQGAVEPRAALSDETPPVEAPRIVAIGGGHGLAASLRALKHITPELTAIVSVADDGGSSGRLREACDQVAPGDIRKCLLALADDSTPLAKAFAYRFHDGELEGHAFGNLMLSALTNVSDALPEAVDYAGQLLGIVGRVLPATMAPVDLVATRTGGDEIRGQVAVMEAGGIERVHLEPADSRPPYSAFDAIAAADLFILGPGSLYTSVLAAAVAPGLVEAMTANGSPIVYLSNLRPQPGETDGYTVADHVAALNRHRITPDIVLFDPATIGDAPDVPGAQPVPLADHTGRAHDPALLTYAVQQILASG